MNQITTSPSETSRNREIRPTRAGASARSPVVDIHQDTDGFTLEVEMPGVPRSGVEVTFDDGRLILRGHREIPGTLGRAVHSETDEADYRRVFDLDPSIDSAGIEAQIQQGLLTVRLPKAETAKPRKIAIQ